MRLVGLTSGVTAIAVGSYSCAVTSEAKVMCWGPNDVGQLDGEPAPEPSAGATTQPEGGPGSFGVEPVEVGGLPEGMSSVSVGASHTCAATAVGAVSCWGANDSGQLGDGTTLSHRGPVALAVANERPATSRAVKVNIIMVDSALDVATDVPEAEQKSATAMAQRLTAQDPILMRAIQEAFRGATSGIFEPTLKVVKASKRLELSGSGCLDRNSEAELVQAAARPRQVEAAINIIVAKALICSDTTGETIGGYDNPNPGNLPVVGWIALGRQELVYDMIHEWGHDAGLLHAGLSDCQDRVTLTHCTIDEVGDPNTVMSYTHTTDAFTTAELYEIGFIGDQEVVAVRNSTTEEFQIGTGRTAPSTLLIDRALDDEVIQLRDRVYISGEPGQLEVRWYSMSEQESIHGLERAQPSLTSVVWFQPQPGAPIYQGKGFTVTYRGSDADGNAILHVTRPNQTTPPAATLPTPSTATRAKPA